MLKENQMGIALFVYNRPYHTKQVLTGLKKNNIDHLYIFSDGPQSPVEDDAVGEVRQLVNSIDWCETNVIKSEHNKGLADSIVEGVNHVLERHQSIIVLEDDCVPAPDFVDFMEVCLEKYEDNERVMNVTGYSPPIEIPEDYSYDIYFSYRSCSWGWGTWQRAWKYFEKSEELLNEIQGSKELRRKVYRAGTDLIPMLERQLSGGDDSWAVYWSLNIIENDGLCVNPVKSLIKNIGHDGSGTNCMESDRYDVQMNSPRNLKKLPDDIVFVRKLAKKYSDFYSYGFKTKIKTEIKIYLKKLGMYKYLQPLMGKFFD